jgi:hypothetical protein
MKWLFIISAFAIFACSGLAYENKNHKEKKTVPKKINGSLTSAAVLELFTSEGCSSCPPADRLLPQLADLDASVIPLSFHVDYWNHLGWKDPFSKAEFSERQRAYGERFHLESIYTPQLIINGEYELVGSSRSTAEADIKKVLSEKPGVEIKIDEVTRHENELSVSCHLSGNWKNTNLAAAVVQKHAEVQVKGGENSGKKLSHLNIVRAFVEKPSESKMNFQVEIPTDLKDDNLQLILYVQQQGDLKVAGAAVYLPTGNK